MKNLTWKSMIVLPLLLAVSLGACTSGETSEYDRALTRIDDGMDLVDDGMQTVNTGMMQMSDGAADMVAMMQMMDGMGMM